MTGREYFSDLNYTMANEDTRVEYGILRDRPGTVLAVAGSGARVVPLLARRPDRLICADMAGPQLHLCRFRLSALRTLDLTDYLGLLGYEDKTPAARQKLLAALDLTDDCRRYMAGLYDHLEWQSLLGAGRWEHMAALQSTAVTPLKGLIDPVFEFTNLSEQRTWVEEHFPWRRFGLLVRALGNPIAFNLMLYKGGFPDKNIPDSFYDYYMQAFRTMLTQTLARENFYLQILFKGRVVYPEGRPLEAQPGVFQEAQAALAHTDISTLQGDLLRAVGDEGAELDFVSLSDVPSYLADDDEHRFYQILRPALRPDALVVSRSYMHVPWRPDTRGFENVTPDYQKAIDQDCMKMYLFDVYRRLAEES